MMSAKLWKFKWWKSTDNLLKNEFKVFYHSIPVVDDEVSDVTSEPGTPSDNNPITASKARGLTLYEKQTKSFFLSRWNLVKHNMAVSTKPQKNIPGPKAGPVLIASLQHESMFKSTRINWTRFNKHQFWILVSSSTTLGIFLFFFNFFVCFQTITLLSIISPD